jgi:hypothetical protein
MGGMAVSLTVLFWGARGKVWQSDTRGCEHGKRCLGHYVIGYSSGRVAGKCQEAMPDVEL